jgi:hypothetical protein
VVKRGAGDSHEFKVVLDGVTLDPDAEARIRKGIQKVVLQELAELDFGGDRGAPVVGLMRGNGHTQGIWARVADLASVQEIFPR